MDLSKVVIINDKKVSIELKTFYHDREKENINLISIKVNEHTFKIININIDILDKVKEDKKDNGVV